MDSDDDQNYERLARTLADTMATAANEALVIARLEEFFDPKPAKLANSKEETADINRRIAKLTAALGGPPELIIQGINDPKPKYDTYPDAAFHEALTLFDRARTSVTRAHMFFIAVETEKKFPNLTQLSQL